MLGGCTRDDEMFYAQLLAGLPDSRLFLIKRTKIKVTVAVE